MNTMTPLRFNHSEPRDDIEPREIRIADHPDWPTVWSRPFRGWPGLPLDPVVRILPSAPFRWRVCFPLVRRHSHSFRKIS